MTVLADTINTLVGSEVILSKMVMLVQATVPLTDPMGKEILRSDASTKPN